MPNLSLQDQTTEFLLYTAPNGEIKVEVLLSNELQEDVVCSILEHTTEHGAIAGKTQTQKVKSDMHTHRGRWERVGETMNNMRFDLPAFLPVGRQVEKRLDGVGV